MSSQQTQGVVTKANTTFSPANAARKWTKKSFLVNDEWYGGFINADNKALYESINEGDAVKVLYEDTGKYKNLVSIQLVEKGEPAKAPVSKSNMTPFSPTEKDFRITFLACRKDAIEFVKAAHQLGMISFGKKKADEMDIFEDLVNNYAIRFAMHAWKIVPVEQVEVDEAPSTKEVHE